MEWSCWVRLELEVQSRRLLSYFYGGGNRLNLATGERTANVQHRER
jgi:hypothetical protein